MLRSAVRGAGWVSAFTCAMLAWVACALPSTAAAAQQLQVSPTKTMLQAEAGATVTANITITAPKSAIDVSYEHVDFGFDKNYQVVLIPDSAKDTTSFSTRRWFTVTPPQFTVKGTATRTVPVRIHIPKNTPSGTYMGAAVFVVTPRASHGGGQIQANVSIASLIFVSVAGGSPPKPKIRRFDVPHIVTHGSFTPDLILDNTGTLGFTADGEIHVDSKEPSASQTFAPQYVQPHKPRTLHVNGSKTKVARVSTESLGMGKHTLTLRLRIDPTNNTLVVKRTFWVIPMWIRVLAALLVLAVILGMSWIVALFRRRRAAVAGAMPPDPATTPEEPPVEEHVGVADDDDEVDDDEVDVDSDDEVDDDAIEDDIEDDVDDAFDDADIDDEPSYAEDSAAYDELDENSADYAEADEDSASAADDA